MEKESVWWESGRLPTTGEAEQEQRDAGEVTRVPPEKENAESTVRQKVPEKEQETEIMSVTQLAQERDGEHAQSEEECLAEIDTDTKEHSEQETEEHKDAEEVISVSAERENAEEEETKHFEKEDMTESQRSL